MKTDGHITKYFRFEHSGAVSYGILNADSVKQLSRGQGIDTVHRRWPPKRIALDMDPGESPTYSTQEVSAYNGPLSAKDAHLT